MVNANKLKGKIVECGLTIESLAEKIGINKATMYRKLANPESLSVREVNLIAKELSMTSHEINAIFFNWIVA